MNNRSKMITWRALDPASESTHGCQGEPAGIHCRQVATCYRRELLNDEAERNTFFCDDCAKREGKP